MKKEKKTLKSELE